MELTRPQVWVMAFVVLGTYSYLVKENPWYRLIEHTYVGLAVGHALTVGLHNTAIPYTQTFVIDEGLWWFLLALPIGLLYYTRFFGGGKYAWLSGYPISISIGWALGYSIARGYRAFTVQMVATMSNLRDPKAAMFFIIFMCTIMYFFFTVGSESKVVKAGSALGRYFMMITFGAGFANIIQGRLTLFLDKLNFLLVEWLRIKPY